MRAQTSSGLFRGALGLLLVAVVAAWWLLAMPDPIPAASGNRGLSVVGPPTAAVGGSVMLSVSGADTALSDATIVVTSTAGSTSFSVPLDEGTADFVLETAMTRSAGVTTVWAIAGRNEATLEITFTASAAVSPTVPLVGPKSIVADGEDHAMVVVLPQDRFGNAAGNAAGSTELSVRRPQGDQLRKSTAVVGLVTWQRVFSGIRAGRAEIAATTGEAYGPTADLDEVPGDPVPFSLTLSDHALQADGRTLHAVQTDELVDRFGNLLVDGTAVEFRIDEPKGSGQATAVTIDGRATLHLEAPEVPGTVHVYAFAAGAASNLLALEFEAAVDELPTDLRASDGRWTLEIGPIRTIDAGFVPDGTTAIFTDDEIELEVMLVGGRATLDLAKPASAEARIRILGVEQRVKP